MISALTFEMSFSLARPWISHRVAKPVKKPTVWIGAGDRSFVLDEQETALWTFRTRHLVFTGTYRRNLIANPDGLEMGDSVRPRASWAANRR